MKKYILTIIGIVFFALLSNHAYALETITVKKGDNFWKLSVKHKVDWYELQKINAERLKIKGNPNLIYPGQIFLLPNAQKQKVSVPQLSQGEEKIVTKEVLPSSQGSSAKEKEIAAQESSSEASEPDTSSAMFKVFAAFGSFMIFGSKIKAMVVLSVIVFLLTFLINGMQIISKHALDCYRKWRKKVFIGYCISSSNYCLASYDGKYVYSAKSMDNEGLYELARFVAESCGFKEIKEICFSIPVSLRNNYQTLGIDDKAVFLKYVESLKESSLVYE